MRIPAAAELPPSLTSHPRLVPITLILGGARSGKSRHAEALIAGAARHAVYLATGEAHDAEMAERIRHHRERRARDHGAVDWLTVEEPKELVGRLADLARPDRPILVDCLTLWLTNLLLASTDIESEIATLVGALPALAGPVVLVANEVGLGIVPDNALARAFRDHAGRLNQAIAGVADRVVFVAAGLPLVLKEAAPSTAVPAAPPSLTRPRKGGGDDLRQSQRSSPSLSPTPKSIPSPLAGES